MAPEDLVNALSPSLGQGKARAVVGSALASLGLTRSDVLSEDDARQVLDEVGKEGGLVAAAVKIAGLRLDTLPR